MTVTERRCNKIMSYLKNKYPEYTFMHLDYTDNGILSNVEIFYWCKQTPVVKGYIFSLNIRLTKKRYQEIERCLGLLNEVK